jgi:hypothetical protein
VQTGVNSGAPALMELLEAPTGEFINAAGVDLAGQ